MTKIHLLLFGGTGDLATKKLYDAFVPALENSHYDSYSVTALGRSQLTAKEFDAFKKQHQLQDIPLQYVSTKQHSPAELKNVLPSGEDGIIYMATPPAAYQSILSLIADSEIYKSFQSLKLLLEKPFGHNYDSAVALDEALQDCFDEDEIYRVDHYIGKEMILNLLSLRFSNVLFESVLNKNHVDHIQITVTESQTVEGRGEYYDEAGAINDMLQNHILQLLSFATMDQPALLNGDKVRDQTHQVIRSLRETKEEDIVLGQYNTYIEHVKQQESDTETLFALKTYIDTYRWKGVPVYIRHGKATGEKTAELHYVFKDVSGDLFCEDIDTGYPNRLSLQIQPNRQIQSQINIIDDPTKFTLRNIDLNFVHTTALRDGGAYRNILEAALRGDNILSIRQDWIESSWLFVDYLQNVIESGGIEPITYKALSGYPGAVDNLINRDGRHWISFN